MKDISNERKIEMFPALLADCISSYVEGCGDDWNELYRIIEHYGFNDEEIYTILDCVIGDYTGLNIEDYKASNFGYSYKIPMEDCTTLFIEPTTDGEDWHGFIENDNGEVLMDSYVQMFDFERESEEDFNISRLIDIFELAEYEEHPYMRVYSINDLADYHFSI